MPEKALPHSHPARKRPYRRAEKPIRHCRKGSSVVRKRLFRNAEKTVSQRKKSRSDRRNGINKWLSTHYHNVAKPAYLRPKSFPAANTKLSLSWRWMNMRKRNAYMHNYKHPFKINRYYKITYLSAISLPTSCTFFSSVFQRIIGSTAHYTHSSEYEMHLRTAHNLTANDS